MSRLFHFLDGYRMSLDDHRIAYERVGIWRPLARDLPDFHTFVARRFGENLGGEGYRERILRHSNGDERAALQLFWEILDEYRAQEDALDHAILPPEG